MIVAPCNILDFTKLVWPILEQLKMWATFEIQNTLNCGPHFYKLQKWDRVFKTLGIANELHMPSLGLRGVHLQMEQIFNHPSWALLLEFKFKSTELKITWQIKSSHEITNSSTMPSYKVNRQSVISCWFYNDFSWVVILNEFDLHGVSR